MSTNVTETAGQRRLREARERVAALEATAHEDAASAPLPVKPGDQIHARMTGVTFSVGGGFLASSHVSTAGETYTVTAALIDASRDTFGNSWLSHLVSDDAQLAAWGEVRFGLGPAPEGIPTWNRYGDADWAEQRAAARAEAWAQPTEEARAAALRAMNERFGPQASTTQYAKYVDPSIKLAEEQQKALNEGGVRFSMHVEAHEAGVTGERR